MDIVGTGQLRLFAASMTSAAALAAGVAARRDIVARHLASRCHLCRVGTLAPCSTCTRGDDVSTSPTSCTTSARPSSLRDTCCPGRPPAGQPAHRSPALDAGRPPWRRHPRQHLVAAWVRLREPVPPFRAGEWAPLLGTLLHARYYFDRYLTGRAAVRDRGGLCVSGSHPGHASDLASTAVLAWYAVAGTHDIWSGTVPLTPDSRR